MKCDDTISRKCGFPFRLREYYMAINVCKFNVVCGVNNQKFDRKLSSYMIVSHLDVEENKIVVKRQRTWLCPKTYTCLLKERGFIV